ncbi:MAG: hypothetical protein IJH52_00055 [Oscillospiraceae bacterium]|nr:hypothetical protein [Oscillospiraceae bacterium]
MTQSMKKTLALLLTAVQLFLLLPLGTMQAEAAQTEDNRLPRLNPTIVGTVQFQSFNFLGNNETGEDGTDYTSTFYYTDDYFARSAVNPKIGDAATETDKDWSDLEDPSMAACSMDFAVAAMTSAEGDVVEQSDRSWENTDYSEKDKNVESFLSTCGFENISPNEEYFKAPTVDSIGYTLAKKTIRVWNEETRKNEDYTLIAVGIRGAGYGAEWASNVTIGNPDSRLLPANCRHYGFDVSADKVCDGIQTYLSRHNISGRVKYWVVGFSRSAAVAHLVAAKLTDDDGSVEHTQKKDVFGYTYESPMAASTRENALDYKNIHNILNALDAVPKLSPDGFEHQRLGVDYKMPYYQNAGSQNTSYYNRMVEVLKTICTGSRRGEADRLVTDVQNYPYNTPLTMYTITGLKLISDAGSNKLTENFGTVVAEKEWGIWPISGGNVSEVLGASDGGWYIDRFIDELIKVFLVSPAWDRDYNDAGRVA